MNYRNIFSLSLFILLSLAQTAVSQTIFEEGTAVYNIIIKPADASKPPSKGTFTFIIKGKELRKELKLESGYEDIMIYNGNANAMYNLQSTGGKKYAIQLNAKDKTDKTQKYIGFAINDAGGKKQIAGFNGIKATVNYQNGTACELYYTHEITPANERMYDLFPGIKVLPLFYVYKDEGGNQIEFTLSKIKPGPIENANFRIPSDYKVISQTEYKEINK